MKRIETLDETHLVAIRNTLNAARIDGRSAYACPGSRANCKDCPVLCECAGAYHDEPGLIKSFIGWLAWLFEDVKGVRIKSGYRVIYTERINYYHIVSQDGTNLYAKGRPLVLLPVDCKRYTEFAISDVFASRDGAACILVEDTYSGETRLYSDIIR